MLFKIAYILVLFETIINEILKDITDLGNISYNDEIYIYIYMKKEYKKLIKRDSVVSRNRP
jgi:hypothetical protein